jgi:hypothetical protein
MTIKELIEKLQDYDQDMPVCCLDGFEPSLEICMASLEWTDGGDPYSYYVPRSPNGDVEVLLVR